MNEPVCPAGYEKAYHYYMTDSSGISEEEAKQNLMQQLRGGKITDDSFASVVRLARMYAYRPLPEVMADASWLVGLNASADQNYIGAVMLTQSLSWGTVSYKSEAEALRLSVNGFERWLKVRGFVAPWAMASLYTMYAEKVTDVTDKKLFLNKALNLYEYAAVHPKSRVDLYNAVYEFLNIEKDSTRLVRFFEKVDESLTEPIMQEYEKLDEPVPLFLSRPFADHSHSTYEVMQGFWLHFEDIKTRIAATPYLLMLLHRCGANKGAPCGVAYREIIFKRYIAEGEAEIRWVDMVYSLVRAQWTGYKKNRLYLDAEYAFAKGDEGIAKKLLTQYYSKDFETDSSVRLQPFKGHSQKGNENIMSRFNKLVDDVKYSIYKNI